MYRFDDPINYTNIFDRDWTTTRLRIVEMSKPKVWKFVWNELHSDLDRQIWLLIASSLSLGLLERLK